MYPPSYSAPSFGDIAEMIPTEGSSLAVSSLLMYKAIFIVAVLQRTPRWY